MTRPSLSLRLVTLGVFFQFAFVLVYLKSERAINFWDYAMYANLAMDWFAQNGVSSLWAVFQQSLANNYNLLYAVPSLASFSLFGASRSVFILTNFAVFFIAHEVALALVLRRLFALSWPRACAWALGLCTLTPFMWYPLLEGYPDNGAAACFVFALGLSLTTNKTWRQAISVGLLLGLSIALRRHYAYPALALLFTLGSFDVGDILRKRSAQSGQKIKQLSLYYINVVVGVIGLLALLEPAYLREMISTNYAALYKSYERTPSYFILFCLSRIGALLLLAALIGFGSLLKTKGKGRASILRLAALGPVWLLLWAFGPAQAGEHYLISIAPVFCVVGLFGLLQYVPKKTTLTWPSLVCGLLLIINTLHAFWFAPFVLPSTPPKLAFFGTPRPPWVREDYNTLISLARYVQDTTTDRDRIVLAGSSFVFNQDIFRTIYVDLLKDVAPAYRYIAAPESDGIQEPPLDAFAQANIYVVASPAQYHLDPAGQKVVTALVERFPPDKLAAPIFEKDEQTFSLINDVTVSIWRRKKEWSPATLHQELAEIRKVKDSSTPWVIKETTGPVSFVPAKDNPDAFIIRHLGHLGVTRLFFDRPINAGQYRVGMIVETAPSCINSSFSVRVETPEGKGSATRPATPVQMKGAFYIPFTIEDKNNGAHYVTLSLTSTSQEVCTVALWQLQLQQILPLANTP